MKLMIDSDMARMPRNCHECPLGMGSICFWMPSDVDEDRPNEDRPDWCPLTEMEPVKPSVVIDEYRCGECGHKLEHQELLVENILFHEHYRFCPQCGRPVNGMIRAMSSYVISEVLFAEDYVKHWRCWTSRPTDEQREAVKWDEP